MRSPALKKISNKIQEGITWNSNCKKKKNNQSRSACQLFRVNGRGGLQVGAWQRMPGSPGRTCPSWVGWIVPGVPGSSCSRRGESANVSWVFRSYRLTLGRKVVRNHCILSSPCPLHMEETIQNSSPMKSQKTQVHCHKVYSAYLSSFQVSAKIE